MANEIVLETSGLTKQFGKITAVDNLSLHVYRGDIFGFLGPNGAGKTTTIRMILGLVRPTAGNIVICGLDGRRDFLEAISRIGAVVDEPAFYPYLSAEKNLKILAKLSGNGTEKRIDGVLDAVGLLERKKDKVKTYSHGMRQRLDIAQALLHEPEILILDEPTNGLDPEGSREILALIRNLAENSEPRVTVMISSHLLEEVEQICNRAAIIREGKLLLEESVAELIKEESHSAEVTVSDIEHAKTALSETQIVSAVRQTGELRLIVELHGDHSLSELNAFLVKKGVSVMALIPKKKRLKEFFLDLMDNTKVPSGK